ncbi:MFS transporter [Nonomuraea sp. NPDC000554]|uniref:MFS transporter n=1 Tax=Nonomuraea sp. NPDC000554 TaxID=3154259 RepID=UPI00333031CA
MDQEPRITDISAPAHQPTTPTSVPGGLRHSLRAFRHRDFTIFWCGALASNTGSWLSNLSVPYVLYQITGSAFWVGLVSLAQFLPGILLSPAGGSLADRRNRKRVLLFTQSGMAVSAFLLWLIWTSGLREPVVLLLLVGLGGVFAGINIPSWQAFVSDLVPRNDLHSAVTLNSLQFNAARSIGPALAGLLLAALGPAWTFLLNAGSFAFVLAALSLIRFRHDRPPHPTSEGVTRQFLAALGYVRRQPGLVVSLVVSVLVGILGNPIFQFTVVFAESVFDVGPVGLGVLNASLGIGAVIAAPLVSGWSHKVSLGQVVRWGLLIYGAAIVAFGAAPGYAFGVLALVVVGGSFLAVVSTVNTAIQVIVADHMRGRVVACRIMFYTASFPVGGLLQGSVSDWLGPRSAVCGAGALMLAAAVLLMRWRGRAQLSRLDDPHDERLITATS